MALPRRAPPIAAMARSSMRISSALSKFLERFASIHVAISRWCSSSSLLGVGAGREGFGRRVLADGTTSRVRARAKARVGIRLSVRVRESRRPRRWFELQGRAPLRDVEILSRTLLVRVYAMRLLGKGRVSRRPAFSVGVLTAPKPAATQAHPASPPSAGAPVHAPPHPTVPPALPPSRPPTRRAWRATP